MTQTEKLVAFYGSVILAKLFDFTYEGLGFMIAATIFLILYLKDL